QLIYEDNLRRIREADGVIANLVNFRGLEPDSGTVFEMGFAIALGKPVVGYGVAPGDYAGRVAAQLACERDATGRLVESASRRKVEDMGYPLNLMLACSAPREATAEQALARMATFF
ncbi:MAG: nucleoside 2-deoxyribosyltransferase, partial [Rubrivivax sp.]